MQEIIDERIANPPEDKARRDMLDVLVSITDDAGNPRFSADEITGMFISLMFAGHHTSAGTAAWTLIELMRHPRSAPRSPPSSTISTPTARRVSFHALRQIPKLENVIKGDPATAPR